jgi:hypothetical protein
MKTDIDLLNLYFDSCCASQGAYAITLQQEEEFVKNIESMNIKTKKVLLGRNAGMLDDVQDIIKTLLRIRKAIEQVPVTLGEQYDDSIRSNTEYPGDS